MGLTQEHRDAALLSHLLRVGRHVSKDTLQARFPEVFFSKSVLLYALLKQGSDISPLFKDILSKCSIANARSTIDLLMLRAHS